MLDATIARTLGFLASGETLLPVRCASCGWAPGAILRPRTPAELARCPRCGERLEGYEDAFAGEGPPPEQDAVAVLLPEDVRPPPRRRLVATAAAALAILREREEFSGD
jgi:hypothetical protein